MRSVQRAPQASSFDHMPAKPGTGEATAAPDPSHIAIFVLDLAPTGVSRNAYSLADALSNDHEVDLIAGRDGPMRSSLRTTVLGPDLPAGLPALMRMAIRLRRHFKRRPPAVAISVGIRGHAVLAAALAGCRHTRRIYRISNDLGHAGTRRGLEAILTSLQTRVYITSAHRLVPVSPDLLADRQLARAERTGRVTIIENGVDLDFVCRRAREPVPAELAFPKKLPFVLGIGSYLPQKNWPVLISAVGAANATRPLGLVIIGTGEDAPRNELLRMADVAGIADRFLLPGYVANPYPFFVLAAAFALPSLWEGASNALLEALALRRPIIASRSAGNARKVLGEGRYGAMADPLDIEEWRKAVLRQTGDDPISPGRRVDSYRLADAMRRWRALVAEERAFAEAQARRPSGFVGIFGRR